jgi:hypothetical protein
MSMNGKMILYSCSEPDNSKNYCSVEDNANMPCTGMALQEVGCA